MSLKNTEKIFWTFVLGLNNTNFFKHVLFDKNVMGIIRDFFVSEFFLSIGDKECKEAFKPVAVVVHSESQRLFVLDQGSFGKNIQIFSTKRSKPRWIGEFNPPLALCLPMAMIIHPLSNLLYIVDYYKDIKIATLDGKIIGNLGKNLLKGPRGIACDSITGFLYVTDSIQNIIFIFGEDGILKAYFGNWSLRYRVNIPDGICIDSKKQEVFVVEHGNKLVSVFSMYGKFLRIIGKELIKRGPFFTVLHPLRPEILVIEGLFYGKILIFNRDTGKFVKKIGGFNNFNEFQGIYFDSKSGACYICVKNGIICRYDI